MKALLPVLELLQAPRSSRLLGIKRAFDAVVPLSSGKIEQFLFGPKPEPRFVRLAPFLEAIADSAATKHVQRSITDWPFENFWSNPYEPRRSKLLSYFIDPVESHGCGAFLLEQLLSILGVLPVGGGCSSGGWKVATESGQIDVLITRDCPESKCAIIIENKINGAVDQENQLERYVDKVGRSGFDDESIYVFYLPLLANRSPALIDKTALEARGIQCRTITFENDILKWLDLALRKEIAADRVENLPEGMRQNLVHYRSLITYLINKSKVSDMYESLLIQLEEAGKSGIRPTWKEVEDLQSAVGDLQNCLKNILRGELFMRVKEELRQRRPEVDLWLCFENESTEKISSLSPYDKRLGESIDLCVRVDDFVSVCIGGNAGNFWTGYLKNMAVSPADEHELAAITAEIAAHFPNGPSGTSSPWYAWSNRKLDFGALHKPEIVQQFTDLLLGMHDDLTARLRVSREATMVPRSTGTTLAGSK